eukprot:IDg13829t1
MRRPRLPSGGIDVVPYYNSHFRIEDQGSPRKNRCRTWLASSPRLTDIRLRMYVRHLFHLICAAQAVLWTQNRLDGLIECLFQGDEKGSMLVDCAHNATAQQVSSVSILYRRLERPNEL